MTQNNTQTQSNNNKKNTQNKNNYNKKKYYKKKSSSNTKNKAVNSPQKKQESNAQPDDQCYWVCPDPQEENKTAAPKKPQPKRNTRYNRNRRSNRTYVLETVDDVKKDILRIEKEIRLEIEEIKTIGI